MKRWLIAGLLLVLFSAGCQFAPETPEQVAGLASYVRSGVQGLRMNFIQGLPPSAIYDVDDLVIVAELSNVGAEAVEADYCFVELTGPASNIVSGLATRQSCGDIDGKSVFNTEGGFNQIEFKSSNVILPAGVDKYSPNLVLSACYDYKTLASAQVCVDPSFYQLTAEQKACMVRDVPLGGGQGAPVSVNDVKVDMVGQKALFEIDISNAGGGKVVSPRASLERCPGSLRYDDFDEVRYNVKLAGEFPADCTPKDNIARLSNNQGKIFCTFNIGSTAAYEAPLQIELNYGYMQSISKKIDIIRTPR